jgi:hypothetical protein
MPIYVFVVGFVGAFRIGIVNRFETNRTMARILTALVFLISALCIVAKLDGDTATPAHGVSASGPNSSDPANRSNVSP